MKQQTAVEWLVSQQKHNQFFDIETIEQAKEMEKQQAQNYAEFCVMCDRENLPLLDFESYILTYTANK
jgi:chloramphenicol O-acetyltransferase